MSLVRDEAWGNDRMFVVFNPANDEILLNGRTLGKNKKGPGLAKRAANLGVEYVIHQFPHIREAP